jgi:hypothetical protein
MELELLVVLAHAPLIIGKHIARGTDQVRINNDKFVTLYALIELLTSAT